MALKTKAELKAYFNTGDKPTESQFADLIDSLFGITDLPKIYRALLSQSSTSDPTATVLENTLGGTVVWSRASAGTYRASLSNAFTANKTFILICNDVNGDVVNIQWQDVSTIVVTTNGAIDSKLSKTSIEIIVYS